MRRLLLSIVLLMGACAAGEDPAPFPSTSVASSTGPAPVTTSPDAIESPSGVLSSQLRAWSQLGIADYDLEYVIERDGGGDSGTYRSEVRDGEPVNCFLDGELSMRLECDPRYYSVESIFERIVDGDSRTAIVTYDEEWHLPSVVNHELRADLGDPYRLEVVSFRPREPIDWVAYVANAVDWLQETYSGDDMDWAEVREEALALVEANPRRQNAYLGLDRATQLVRGALFRTPREESILEGQDHDVHSFRDAQLFAGQPQTGPPPSGQRIGDVGYLRLAGAFPERSATYAGEVHDLMARIDADPVCGWVVDLRDPHFIDPARDALALGPLLEEGTILAYRLAGAEDVFSYTDGVVELNGEPVMEVYEAEGLDTSGLTLEGDLYHPAHAGAPVAVLTSIESGTWPLVAIARRDGTRVFGEPPQGGLGIISLGERPSLALPLGARLYAPRDGDSFARLLEPYDPQPDELVLSIPGSRTDEVLEAALDWLEDQPTCGED